MQQTERINPFPTRCVLKLNTALLVRVAVMVYSNVSNRATAKLSSALALREATTVLHVASIPGNRKTQHRTNVARNATVSTIISIPGHRNKRIRRCVKSPLKKPTRECWLFVFLCWKLGVKILCVESLKFTNIFFNTKNRGVSSEFSTFPQ